MTRFVWDAFKEIENVAKHGVNFEMATRAFSDPHFRIFYDSRHSQSENRFFCVGKVENKILTVRFTFRDNDIRIIGAGYWRKGRTIYEKKNR